MEVIEAEIGPEGEPVVFDFAPEDFDQVEFGAIVSIYFTALPCLS